MDKFSVAVVGASGYGGAEIVRLLSTHPRAEVTVVTSGRTVGKPLHDVCPWLDTTLTLTAFEPESLRADFTFLCQEKGFAMDVAENLLSRTRVLDLSADFRLKDVEVYRHYYGIEHRAPQLLSEAVYGLPELSDRQSIANARLVAVPGCYPTACGLGIAPLADHLSGTPIIDAKSGVSGAGRSRTETDYLFSEVDGGFRAYGAIGHRHTPEIEQYAGRAVRFTPHLLPTARGIHATIHAPLAREWTVESLRTHFLDRYADEPFVAVVDQAPSTKQVIGSNRCAIWVDYDERTGHAVVCSVIDNLIKGAAGQAIQCLNLMAGIPEDTGLPKSGLWP